jgi:FKBP-type peptidyl-prolyl cis-trans isomerase
VKEGKGEAVKPGATVVIHYTGWLTDDKATKFDSSLDRGTKAEFGLDMLIKGWQEGIPGMKPGGVRRLKIPAELAYGAKARGKIPANSTLVFEIELFEAK